MKSLKGIIRNIIERNDGDNINWNIHKIKSILHYISRVILIIIESKNKDLIKNIDYILNRSENKFEGTYYDIFIDMEEKYDFNLYLNKVDKLDIINILLSMDTNNFKESFLGELYESFTTAKERQYLGQVYTPKYIVKYMINSSIKKEDIINNPYFKVIDPSCGGGYFLIEAYKKIKDIFNQNYDEIMYKNPYLKLSTKDDIHKFILTNNIWGTDIDEFSVFITAFSLIVNGTIEENIKTNIIEKDILLEDELSLFNYDESFKVLDNQFDLVMGNPPYIGHKKIDKLYRNRIASHYEDVYSDKSDISYCFFKKGYELLKEQGKLVYITSRYFQEAPSAKKLRDFILNRFHINRIIDFYGENIFKGASVSSAIIECEKSKELEKNIMIYRLMNNTSIKEKQLYLDENYFEIFKIDQSTLKGDKWIIVNGSERKVFKKIERRGNFILDDICICNQGIITGYDKAFIVDIDTIEKENLEKKYIKAWIKNSDIMKYREPKNSKYILYTDSIEDISECPNIMNRLSKYRERLSNRRECKKNTREWYQLQWGRNKDVFKNEKILFPYKSKECNFTICNNEVYCSADVYILNIKKQFKDIITLEYLTAFLNSSLFEFYFKIVAKKLNDKLYDFYPNKIMSLKIKVNKEQSIIKNLVNDMTNKYTKFHGNEKELNHYITTNQRKINEYFYSIYDLTKDDIRVIENKLNKLNTK
ncbi:hypothetical protein CLPU_3c03280 [Gottschalkia purinilytica]|uniref:site-specific DNA-methyltransferase (adenine-specific) n=1 Tax=Gottschalkia purinilytica TaxID=1503 RepID=A0A0L0WDJ6_GOTPU|nr:DNA methyltransferase [Gottschalkia purinilytica]KNF09548.1 hypothetical protein CLPU_3c03280 [Gottschalkia purinilytica]